MILKVYSIMDLQVGHFTQPFYAPSHGAALRMFADHVNDPQTMASKHPEDFMIAYLADFDDEQGRFTPLEKWQKVGTASEYKKKPDPDNQISIEDAINRKLAAKKGA